jgi:hypothetical protein
MTSEITGASLPPKSPIGVQPPEVMRSGAGFYVGCCTIDADGLASPHSRFSDYYRVASKAQDWLDQAVASNSL